MLLVYADCLFFFASFLHVCSLFPSSVIASTFLSIRFCISKFFSAVDIIDAFASFFFSFYSFVFYNHVKKNNSKSRIGKSLL
jgi:hypothetical protein